MILELLFVINPLTPLLLTEDSILLNPGTIHTNVRMQLHANCLCTTTCLHKECILHNYAKNVVFIFIKQRFTQNYDGTKVIVQYRLNLYIIWLNIGRLSLYEIQWRSQTRHIIILYILFFNLILFLRAFIWFIQQYFP